MLMIETHGSPTMVYRHYNVYDSCIGSCILFLCEYSVFSVSRVWDSEVIIQLTSEATQRR